MFWRGIFHATLFASFSRFNTGRNHVKMRAMKSSSACEMITIMRSGYIAALVLLAPVPAAADGEILSLITEADKARLAQHETARATALDEAREGGSADDVATLEQILSKEQLPFSGLDLSGSWQCRTIKAGGLASLVIYDWFRCRITDDGSGWRLTKETGSQRTTGRFFTDSDTRLTYLGSFYVAGDKPPPYGSGAETDQVGYAFRSGEAEWRIEFPLPARESKLDILEFRHVPIPSEGDRR